MNGLCCVIKNGFTNRLESKLNLEGTAQNLIGKNGDEMEEKTTLPSFKAQLTYNLFHKTFPYFSQVAGTTP